MVPHCSRIDSPALQAAFPSQSPLSAGCAGPRRAWPSGCNLRGPPPAPPGKRSPVTRSLLDRASSPRRVPGTRPFPPLLAFKVFCGYNFPLEFEFSLRDESQHHGHDPNLSLLLYQAIADVAEAQVSLLGPLIT